MKTATANAKYPEILADLEYQASEVITKELREFEITKSQAERIARVLVQRISLSWGGQQLYIPKNTFFERNRRNQEICKKWNGRNAMELCREYGLTRMRLYQILKVPRNKHTDG